MPPRLPPPVRRPLTAYSGTLPGRVNAVLALFAVMALMVFSRAVYLQVIKAQFLNDKGDREHKRVIALPAMRGAIVDRRGQALALSAPVQDIWADPGILTENSGYLGSLAILLGAPLTVLKSTLRARANADFIYLARGLAPEQAQRIASLNAPGLFVRPSLSRFYPAGEVAANVVGFCGIDGNGLEGIELAFESSLHGTPGSAAVIRNEPGKIVEGLVGRKEPEPGADIALSIDLRLQYLAYRELSQAIRDHDASGGMLVAADPRSGEILAMVSLPGFNPNAPSNRQPVRIRNRPVTDTFEPGSTIKPLLIATALDSGVISDSTQIDTGDGTLKIGASLVHDVHANGVVDLATLLAKSSNVGAAKIGLVMGPEAVWAGYQRFGVGEPVRAGLLGEAAPKLRPWAQWGNIGTASASFGYGISVTALQLLRAYCAIANDGLMPVLTILRDHAVVPPQRVVSAATARKVRKLLRGVVSIDGTAVHAAVSNYAVAGKTGTVRMVEGGAYAEHDYRALFVGMIPAAQPQLVALVVLERPQGPDYFGGSVSGPVFSRFMGAATRLMKVTPG